MRGLATLFLVLFFYDLTPAQQKGEFDFISPVPGSELVSCETNIILRPREACLIPGSMVTVTGSRSGAHVMNSTLSDDHRTMIFRPSQPFLTDEVVTVSLLPGLKSFSGNDLEEF